MKNSIKIATLLTLVLFMFVSNDAFAQRANKAGNRLNNVKRTKLVELLDLSETEKNKFNDTYNSWDDKLQSQRKINHDAMIALSNLIDENPNSSEISKSTDNVIKAQEQMHNLMQQRTNEFKKQLNDLQFAKFITYDRRFYKDVQNSMMKFYKNKGNGNNKNKAGNLKNRKFNKGVRNADCINAGTCNDPNCPNYKKN